MICEPCHGTGKQLLRSYPGNELFPYPCEACGGTGQQSCCEGGTGRACDEPTGIEPAGYVNPDELERRERVKQEGIDEDEKET